MDSAVQDDVAGSNLDDLLADDLIQAVMRADKVDPASIRALVRMVTWQRGIAALGQHDGADASSPKVSRGRAPTRQ